MMLRPCSKSLHCMSSCPRSLRLSKSIAYSVRSYVSIPSIPARPFRLAIIGSGPAGFYAASRIMREHNQTVVDMYERLPIPFGLVRFGVAPDHPEVKNCQDRFEEIASLPNFNFIGNVKIGEQLSVEQLKPHYDALLFAYGASKDRALGIPGENLPGVLSARAFVAWYNGLPEFQSLQPTLQGHGSEAVIIGQGNVALDVARMLLANVDELRKTDTPEPVLEALSRNDFRTVRIMGRRGPCQAAFTIKELRELSGTGMQLKPVPARLFPLDLKALPRPRQRIAKLLQNPSNNTATAERTTELRFFLSPTSIQADSGQQRVDSTTFAQTRIKDEWTSDQARKFSAEAHVEIDETAPPVTISSGILFRSIGYKAEALPGLQQAGVPFDASKGIIPNIQGRVLRPSNHSSDGTLSSQSPVGNRFVPGMYVTGWVKRGPTGVIATTMADAFETADAIVADIRALQNQRPHQSASTESDAGEGMRRSGWAEVRNLLPADARPVSWADWKAIDAVERRAGEVLGKPREKITSVKEMLRVLDG